MRIFVVLILILITVSSCNIFRKDNEAKWLNKIYQEVSEKKLELPDSVFVLDRNCKQYKHNINLNRGDKLKIINRIDGSCGKCINDIKRWEEEIIREIDTNFVNIHIIIYTDDPSNFTNVICPEIDIIYPLLIDTLNSFVINNDLPRFDNRFHSFLLDRNNNIILIGSPLHSRKLKTLYLDEIEKRIGF
jgi:hypothetical protein